MWVRSPSTVRLSWVLLLGSPRTLNQGVGRSTFVCGGSGDEFTCTVIQVADRIQLHAGIELRSLFSHWVSNKSDSQPFEAAHIPCLMAPFFHLQSQQWQIKSFSCFRSLRPILTHLSSSQSEMVLI